MSLALSWFLKRCSSFRNTQSWGEKREVKKWKYLSSSSGAGTCKKEKRITVLLLSSYYVSGTFTFWSHLSFTMMQSSRFFFFLSFISTSWRLITLQYCSGFCHTLTVGFIISNFVCKKTEAK